MKPYWYAALLLTAACAFEPPREEPIIPLPAEYRIWWQQTEECSGHRGDFDRVTWLQADLEVGFYGHTDGSTVWIDRDYTMNRRVVSHEGLHVLLGGDPQHRDKAWQVCNLWGIQAGQ